VFEETKVFAGLFLVTEVGFAVKFAVVHVTDALHVDAFKGIEQEDAEIVPDGNGPHTVVVTCAVT
jgi:alpha-D-ribose 1-methylphosphonate 5-triphosphate synthase subunit PhnI